MPKYIPCQVVDRQLIPDLTQDIILRSHEGLVELMRANGLKPEMEGADHPDRPGISGTMLNIQHANPGDFIGVNVLGGSFYMGGGVNLPPDVGEVPEFGALPAWAVMVFSEE